MRAIAIVSPPWISRSIAGRSSRSADPRSNGRQGVQLHRGLGTNVYSRLDPPEFGSHHGLRLCGSALRRALHEPERHLPRCDVRSGEASSTLRRPVARSRVARDEVDDRPRDVVFVRGSRPRKRSEPSSTSTGMDRRHRGDSRRGPPAVPDRKAHAGFRAGGPHLQLRAIGHRTGRWVACRLLLHEHDRRVDP